MITITTRDPTGADGWVRWRQPVAVWQTQNPVEIPGLLRNVEAAAESGGYALGFLAYEAGPAFDAHFAVKPAVIRLPLLWFAVFDRFESVTPDPRPAGGKKISWRSGESKATYCRRIRTIKKHIAAGETYQVNYTFPLTTDQALDFPSLFHDLYEAQPTPYAMLIQTDAFQIASVSPELFFRLDGDRIICEPMKGTCPRAPHPALDAAAGEQLRTSAKNRAENLMIVDMVRNDLGRIAEPGSVQVGDLFTVTAWPTLWQMTSSVSARTSAGLAEIFAALFPSASITGAPKLKTSEIIAALESQPRGLYTGAIGWCLPDRRAQFAVSIRTAARLEATGTASYGIGSGIVWDSMDEDEYQECRLKARVLEGRAALDFHLLETLRWDQEGGFILLDEHLQRMQASARYFGYSFRRAEIHSALQNAEQSFGMPSHRVRLSLGRDGSMLIEDAPLLDAGICLDPTAAPLLRAVIDDHRQNIDTPFLYHKTTRRRIYENARKRFPDAEEVLLVNHRGEVMEFTAGNVVVRRHHEWVTPPVDSGLLPGVFRQKLIESRVIKEQVVPVAAIGNGDEIYFINSVRGWRRINRI